LPQTYDGLLVARIRTPIIRLGKLDIAKAEAACVPARQSLSIRRYNATEDRLLQEGLRSQIQALYSVQRRNFICSASARFDASQPANEV